MPGFDHRPALRSSDRGGMPDDESFGRPPIPEIVLQHVEDAAHLGQVRARLLGAPHVRLAQLGRLDERIAAQFDGIAVAGDYGAALCRQALDPPSAGTVFVAAVQALDSGDRAWLDRLIAVAGAVPGSRSGLYSAFGWVSPSCLRGVAPPLLRSADPWQRQAGLMCCARHRVDPGPALVEAISADDAALRACALRIAGVLGRSDLREQCTSACFDRSPRIAWAAAVGAALLGDRRESVAALGRFGAEASPYRGPAIDLWIKLSTPLDARAALEAMFRDGSVPRRLLIRAVGVAGDPYDMPWLIDQMHAPAWARIAGEAFSLVTGSDLAFLDLTREPPGAIESGPSDDPDDDDVSTDEDEDLPWPDPARVATWWRVNGARFASGARHFMGETLTAAHCRAVLESGFQRQRRDAAEHLVLQCPGTPLFDVSAPAWRQRRLLSS